MQFGQRNAKQGRCTRADEIVSTAHKIKAVSDMLAGRKQLVEQGEASLRRQFAAHLILAASICHAPPMVSLALLYHLSLIHI